MLKLVFPLPNGGFSVESTGEFVTLGLGVFGSLSYAVLTPDVADQVADAIRVSANRARIEAGHAAV